MAEQWRIFVVVDEESLNRNIISSLRKDGYIVNGATNGRDAVRTLWAEVHDIVICDLNTPGADGFELLQWLRAYRPNTRVILVGNAIPSLRTQALEGGAVSYLEKPLDLHLLKEELRRLLVQTGFSADLDSFDLLDVIQIISASRNNIALLVNTGLEERGMLCFQQGNLVWAEYGTLRGEEAFFALAAHKNGTVIHQPWNQQVMPNVTQPLSRLILQAFQYRTKYNQIQQQLSGEHNVLQSFPTSEDEDAPFLVLTEHITEEPQEAFPVRTDAFASMHPAIPVAEMQERDGMQGMSKSEKEWWEQTGKFAGSGVRSSATNVPLTPLVDTRLREDEESLPLTTRRNTTNNLSNGENARSDDEYESGKRNELPSWLTDQPTASDMPVIRSPSPTIPKRNIRSSLVTPVVPTPSEWQSTQPRSPLRTPQRLVEQRVKEATGPQKSLKTDSAERKAASPEWQSTNDDSRSRSGPLQSLGASDTTLPLQRRQITSGDRLHGVSSTGLQAVSNPAGTKKNYNYTALVSALQTLGFSIHGFVAAAVVSIDGQPIAQVAVDDLDMAPMCKHFSMVMKSAIQSLDADAWGEYENIVLTSNERHVFMRAIGGSRKAFQVLVTTREANPAESSEVMANVEGAIIAALH